MPLDGRQLAIAARNITRWERPKPAEPAHGFLLRVAARHHEPSAANFALDLGIDNNMLPRDCLDALLASRFATEADKAALAQWTPTFEGPHAILNGQTMRRGDWTIATRRFCPACLAEDAYHRSWFDLTFVTTCPFHGVGLDDRDRDGGKIGWARAAVDATSTGDGITRPAPRLLCPPETIEAYGLGRLGLLTPAANQLLDPWPLGQVLEAAEMMGRLALGGRRETMPLLGRLGFPEADLQAAGYAVLKDGETGVRRLFREVAAMAPETAFGARTLFGWAYTGFSFKESLSIELRRLMTAVAADLGRHGRQHRAEQAPTGDCLTMREIAQAIGCPEDTATHLAEILGAILPHAGRRGTPLLAARASVDAISNLFDRSVTRTEAAWRLRIDPAGFAEIVLAGHVEKLGTRWGESGLEDRFHLDEIEGFLARIPCEDENDLRPGMEVMVAPHLLTVPAALRATAYDVGAFFTDVFAGQIIIHARTGLAHGLDDFRINPGRQPPGNAFTRRLFSTVLTRSSRKAEGMTQREACALLDVNPPTAKVLTDLGYLRVTDGQDARNRQKLEPRSVTGFAERYAAGKLYAATLACQPSKVPLLLRKKGITDLVSRRHASKYEAKLSPLYDRAEMRLALGLARDPDEGDDARLFWKEVATSLGQHRSHFMLWQVHDGARATFSNANREWPIHVEYLFDQPQPTIDGFPDAYCYTIRAELKVGGADGRKRIASLAQAARTREAPAPIRVEVDEAAGDFSATLDAVVVIRNGVGRWPMGIVMSDGRRDAPIIHRMLDTLKGAFEAGERPYDHRTFGLWPGRFWQA